MNEFLFFLLCWVFFFAIIALCETFVGSYYSPIDWWYCVIDKRPQSGIWYYGSRYSAKLRIKQ